jgi:hypothetical protein
MPKRVVWTPAEVGALAEAVVMARLEDPVSGFLALLKDAQKAVLPAHRRRVIHDTRDVAAVVDAVRHRLSRIILDCGLKTQAPLQNLVAHGEVMVAYAVATILRNTPGASSHLDAMRSLVNKPSDSG